MGLRIATDGALSGTATGPYSTTWAYYEAGVTATPPAACGGTARTQRGLLQSLTPSGITATSPVVDLFGRLVAVTNGAGTLCRVYDGEGRLTSDKAAGECPRRTIQKLERYIIQIDRGPLNHERFRGTRN